MSLRQRIVREWHFARRVPSRQIIRRAALNAKQRVEAVFQPSLDPGANLTMGAAPALPLFPPRRGMAVRSGGEWDITFLGRTLRMPDAFDWHAPVDRLWLMNLHYMEYLEELDDAEVSGLIGQWTAANPPYRPGFVHAGWNAYALSLRVVVWMQQLALRHDRLDLATLAVATRSLGRQLIYLERHLETDIGGNHLIKNIKALIWASHFFSGPAAVRWRRLGLRLLAQELPRQILSDGTHFERSPSYHCQVLADLLEIRHVLGESAKSEIVQELDDAIDRGVQVAVDLAHPDGKVAQFGDAGLSMAYRPQDIAAAFTKLYGRRPEPRGVFQLAAGGYLGIRSGDDYFVIDAGPIAEPALPAHGHGDAFSFEWSVGGQRLIVDQGVYEYLAGTRRHASRTAARHNTLCLEGGDQAEFYGAFRCGRQARVEVLEASMATNALALTARHDGFARLPGRPVHRRTVTALPTRLRIEDHIEGESNRVARVGLLLAPEVKVSLEEEGILRLTLDKTEVVVRGDPLPQVEPAVWWPDMGVERATHRLVATLAPGESQAWIELEAAG